MAFDFHAAVNAPFRMQPGLRRVAEGSAQLTPLPSASRHRREKLAVLSAFWADALCAAPGFEPGPALQALFEHAAREHPDHWHWDGQQAHATALGVTVAPDGHVSPAAPVRFSAADEVVRCLSALPPAWRQAALASLCFAEDFAIVDGTRGTIPWLAVALPSHWAPAEKIGRHFTQVHQPVADNQLLLKAGDSLMRLVTGPDRWERFVWNVTDQPRLHAHPARVDPRRWRQTLPAQAWWRSERQTFIPVPGQAQAVFTIGVDVQPLASVVNDRERAATLHAAIATMSPSVLAYRNLTDVRDPLLAWLAERM